MTTIKPLCIVSQMNSLFLGRRFNNTELEGISHQGDLPFNISLQIGSHSKEEERVVKLLIYI